MALAACEPEETGGSVGSSSTAADDGTEESSGGESSSDGGEESTGEPLPDCLTPGGDPCPADGQCWTSPDAVKLYDESTAVGGSICLEPCSGTGACKAGLECVAGLRLEGVNVGDVCVDTCHFQGGVVGWSPSCGGDGDDSPLGCADNVAVTIPAGVDPGICVWPEG